MKSQQLALSIFAAVVVGAAQTLFLGSVWAYIAVHSPLPMWLLSLGVSGFPWRATLYAVDSVLNVLLSLPAAYLLCLLKPRRIFLYLLLAVVPGFLWQYSLVFENPSAFSPFMLFVPGIVSALFMLPIATWVVFRVARRENA